MAGGGGVKQALLQVALPMLRELFGFPKGIEVVNSFSQLEYPGTITLILEGDNLPVNDVTSGMQLSVIDADYGWYAPCPTCGDQRAEFLKFRGPCDRTCDTARDKLATRRVQAGTVDRNDYLG